VQSIGGQMLGVPVAVAGGLPETFFDVQ